MSLVAKIWWELDVQQDVAMDVYMTSATGSIARLQCLEVTRIGSSETGTCKGLHENNLHECVLNLHMHAPSE